MKKIKTSKIKKAVCCPDPDLPPLKEDFRKTFSWRIFRIMAEFVDGFQFITDFKKAVGIFGSTRAQKRDAVNKQDLSIFQLADSAEEAFKVVKKYGYN